MGDEQHATTDEAPGAGGWTDRTEVRFGAADRHDWGVQDVFPTYEDERRWQCRRCGSKFRIAAGGGTLYADYRPRSGGTVECREGFSDVPEMTLHGDYGVAFAEGQERAPVRELKDVVRGVGWINRNAEHGAIAHVYRLRGDPLSQAVARTFGSGLWEIELADEDEPQIPGHAHEWTWEPPTTAQEIDYGRCGCGLQVRLETPGVPGRPRRAFAWSDAHNGLRRKQERNEG